MNRIEKIFYSRDGLKLFGTVSCPDENPRAIICYVHGIGEYSGRYDYVINRFVSAGFGVIIMDLRGHGKSEGLKAYSPSLENLMDDIGLLIEEAKNRFPGLPVFLFGHSMGGFLAVNYTLRRKPSLSGIGAFSPALRMTKKPSALKLTAAKILSRLMPSMLIPSGVDSEDCSRDPEVVKKIRNDPNHHFFISTRLGIDVYEAGEWAISHAQDFMLPLLIMHGSSDSATSCEASSEFAANVKVDCTFKLWDGLYHELHNEPEKDEVIDYIIRWVEARLGTP